MGSKTIDAMGSEPPAVATTNKSRIPELDGLRGIAIALVVLFHYFYYDPGPDHYPIGLIKRAYVHVASWLGLGWSGVDLFFVLSGFLIGSILLDARGSPNYYKTFYIRRAFRILPLYYACIGAYLVFMAVVVPLMATGIYRNWESGTTLAAHVFFLQNIHWVPYTESGRPWLAVTWSLAVEEQFYLLAPALIALLNKRRLYSFLCCVILGAPLLRLYVRSHFPLSHPNGLDLAYMLMPCRADALAIGILVALLWRNQRFRAGLEKHRRILFFAVAVLFSGFIALDKWWPEFDYLIEQSVGYTWLACFYASLLLLVLSNPRGWVARGMRLSWLRELGKVSYCVYLIHWVVENGCLILLTAVLSQVWAWQTVAGTAAAGVVSFAIARASWRYFENPLLRQGHKYKY